MMTQLETVDTALKLDDLYLCGYLACKGIKPKGLETTGRGRKHFVYPESTSDRLEDLVQRFYGSEVEVSLPVLRNYVKDFAELMRR
jgi:hypothetical protein